MPEDNPEQHDHQDSSEVKVRRRRKRNDPSPESRRKMFLGKKRKKGPKEIAKRVGLIVLGIIVVAAVGYVVWRVI